MWVKTSPKPPLSSFCVGHLLLGVGSSSSVVYIPIETPLDKTNSFFERRISDESLCPAPVSVLGSMRLKPAQSLFMLSHSLWESSVYQSSCVQRAVFPCCFLPWLDLRTLLPPLPHRSLSPEGRSSMKTSYLGLSIKDLLLFDLVHLWVSVFVSTYCRRNFLWW